MSLNNLLIWMSARGRGSWGQFRSAVEQFRVDSGEGEVDGENADHTSTDDFPVYQEVRLNMQRLAHVEFVPPNGNPEWRVVAPSVAMGEQHGRVTGILCGARSPDLYARLSRLNGFALWDVEQFADMPERIRLFAPNIERMQAAARTLDATAQVDAPAALLAAIPPVDDPRSRAPADPPGGPGWAVEWFVPRDLCWTIRHPRGDRNLEPRDVNQWRTGLFKFRMRYQHFCFLRWGGRTFRVPVQVGKYAVLRHRRIRRLLCYDTQLAVLSFPVSCRPPLLVERALVLCSGLLPRFNRALARLEYSEVPLRIARLAAGLLRQEMQEL